MAERYRADHYGAAHDPGSDTDVTEHPSGPPGYGRGPAPTAPAAGPRRPRRRHRVLISLGVVAVVVVAAVAGVAIWADKQIAGHGGRGPVVSVVVPPGASTGRIAAILAGDGVIGSASLFPYYVKFKGGGILYPGTYHLARGESYGAALDALSKAPAVVRDKLVVPEGFTVGQIATAVGQLPDAHLSPAQFLAAAGGQVRSPYQPAGTASLEGLVFPATYEVTAGQSAASLVQQMVAAFDSYASGAGLTAGAARLDLTPYQVVIVASMVEREAKRPQDRGPVASVIYNRLKAGMPLGIDSTLLYGLGTGGVAVSPASVSPDTPSPYNTRLHPGLPPTPIASPGLASLDAAISPPATSYLYYAVTGPGGETTFASSAAAFARIEALCHQKGYCS
ncbi:MAG: endolytic transglycosylase MltG [Acidimicrobiales bacterium]